MGIATPMGAFLSGMIMDKCGRKKANIMIAVPCLLSYLLTYQVTRDQIALLYTARFLAGIAGGKTQYIYRTSNQNHDFCFEMIIDFYRYDNFKYGIRIRDLTQRVPTNFLIFTYRILVTRRFVDDHIEIGALVEADRSILFDAIRTDYVIGYIWHTRKPRLAHEYAA